MKITPERARELIAYNPTTGEFRWRETLSWRAPAGTVAGYVGDGSRLIDIEGKTYTGPRLAWAIHFGEWPSRTVWCKNGDYTDTRIENLAQSVDNPNLTAERLREVISYDAETGLVSTLVARRKKPVGSPVGTKMNSGYLCLRVDGKLYLMHRLIWLYVHGAWPEEVIDHINGVRTDNRLANLRAVSGKVNAQNQRVARAKSGLLGAYARHRSDGSIANYASFITVDGRMKNLGRHATPEAAHAAFVEAKRKHHVGCTI